MKVGESGVGEGMGGGDKEIEGRLMEGKARVFVQ